MKKQKMVHVRMPKEVIQRVARIAKLADVTPTSVYNVLLAAYLEMVERSEPQKGD